MTRTRVLTALLLSLSLISAPSFAAVKAGAKCTKAGSTATASGKKFTCIKSGTKLVWNKGVITKAAAAPTPSATPTPIKTSIPTESSKPFTPWSTTTTIQEVVQEADKKFRIWAASRTNLSSKHKLLIQENFANDRSRNFQLVDNLGIKLFGSLLPSQSTTVIGKDENWVVSQLNANGGTFKSCAVSAGNSGLNYCIEPSVGQGYVVTGDLSYESMNPGVDGSALLAHEFFHIVQNQLLGNPKKQVIKDGRPSTANLFPVWLVEGSANFVGYAVAALALKGDYWQGYKAMMTYAPPEDSINRNSLEDYEVRNGAGNNTPTYPYITGQIATEYIVASVGFQKLIDIWIDYKISNNFEVSFEKVLGISKESFYAKYDAMRVNFGLPPVTWKLVCNVNKLISGISTTPTPCPAITNGPSQAVPGNQPPPIDKNSNIDGLGCSYQSEDIVNSYGRFVCTELANSNNVWKKQP